MCIAFMYMVFMCIGLFMYIVLRNGGVMIGGNCGF
ncbi:MAG: hypothetical protein Ta2G_02400 [Termitinemataceae bacterium]|nr:MAG: hypothetical protein Ta2G_02400 [Termitinemataceae bacterium]